MYWDVVEVKPEPGYSLFVRFKDGLSGSVQLRREELTGVLAPLLEVKFFERVFVDCGAVAWPGEIDLAPDAMYAAVASGQRDPDGSGGLAVHQDPHTQNRRLSRLGGARMSTLDWSQCPAV